MQSKELHQNHHWIKPSRGSRELYGLDWSKFFPCNVTNKAGDTANRSIRTSNAREALPFFQKNYAEIFQRSLNHQFYVDRMTDQKFRYYELMGDFFTFREQDKIVGALVGTPLDWSTYYLRSCAVLPQHQGKGYLNTIFNRMFPILREHGVQRAECDVAPGNYIEIEFLSRRGFRPMGYGSSERWGSLLRFCKYLDPECEEVFLNQLCDGPRLTRKEKDV